MTVNPVAFYLLSAAILGAALAVVTLRNIVHAAISLVGCLVAVGALYLAVGADFLAGAQILIYAGAIPVLLLFGIMLTRGSMTPAGNGLVRHWWRAAVVAGATAAVLIGVLAGGHAAWHTAVYPQRLLDEGTTETLGRLLLQQHALAFEAASVLLLVALVGAVTLARKDAAEIELERAELDRRLRAERARRRREDRERQRSAAQRGQSAPLGDGGEERAR